MIRSLSRVLKFQLRWTGFAGHLSYMLFASFWSFATVYVTNFCRVLLLVLLADTMSQSCVLG